jgi:hypothetical protein
VRTHLVGLLLLAGCTTGLPTPDGVQLGRPVAGDAPAEDTDLRKVPAGPAKDATAAQVVSGWLAAATDPSTAQRFLAPSVAWDAGASTTIYADLVAEIDRDGALRSRTGRRTISLELRQAEGQWRLSSVPAGVLLPDREARIGRCPVDLTWLSPDRASMVRESTVLPDCDQVDLSASADVIVRALLAGPPARLARVVSTALPAGTSTAGPVRIVQQGGSTVAVVDLAAATSADAASLAAFRVQVERTLRGRGGIEGVRLLVDGQQPPEPESGAAVPADPADVPEETLLAQPGLTGMAVTPDGRTVVRLRPISGGRSVPERGVARPGAQPAAWVAVASAQAWDDISVSRDGTTWLVRGGHVEAVPPAAATPIPVTSPVDLIALRPARDGAHAVGVTPRGALVALLVHGGADPGVQATGSSTPPQLADVGEVSALSWPEEDGSVVVSARVGGRAGLWRVETRLTVEQVVSGSGATAVEALPDPCPSGTVGRLSTAPARPMLAWCRDAGHGAVRALQQGTWGALTPGGPRLYAGG